MSWASEQRANLALCIAYMSTALMFAAPASAQGAFDAWANWAIAPKVWKGQTVPAPSLEPPPIAAVRIDSSTLPLHVHASLRSGERRTRAALADLETAFAALRIDDWPLPPLDGGQDGTPGFDLYLVSAAPTLADGLPDLAAGTAPAGLPAVSDLDGLLTRGSIDDSLSDAALPACVLSAFTQAGMRALDPAEAPSWVRASGALAAWLILGTAGCAEEFVAGQAHPERGFLSDDPSSASAGALFLAVLSARHDRDPGDLVRSLWQSTRQRSHGLVALDRLRSSPDLWETLRQRLAIDRVDLDDELREFAIARYFAGPPSRRSHAAYRVFASLPSDAAVPLTRELQAKDLPLQLSQLPPLESLGSAYLLLATPDLGRSQQLQVWLRAELGPRWSLSAVRLAADGGELGRVSAPARNVPSSYLPLDLPPETAAVLLVITNLPASLPDADLPSPAPHAYELILALQPSPLAD
jgi:hypothetical protein